VKFLSGAGRSVLQQELFYCLPLESNFFNILSYNFSLFQEFPCNSSTALGFVLHCHLHSPACISTKGRFKVEGLLLFVL
jgi:hypothetical protein